MCYYVFSSMLLLRLSFYKLSYLVLFDSQLLRRTKGEIQSIFLPKWFLLFSVFVSHFFLGSSQCLALPMLCGYNIN